MPGYPGAGLYKQGTELGELVSLGLSDAGSIPAASTIFPPFTPRPARRPFLVVGQVFFCPTHTETFTDIQPCLDIPTDTQFKFSEPRTTRTARTRNYSGHSCFFSPLSPLNRIESTADTPFNFHEPRTTRTVRTRRHRLYKLSRFSRVSRLKFHRTLRLNSLNRERRERREQGITADTPVSFLPSLP